MARHAFAVLLAFGLVQFPTQLHAQSVILAVCNAGRVPVEAFATQGGEVATATVGPADCRRLAESAGRMAPAYVGFGLVDARGQWRSTQRLDLLPSAGAGVFERADETASTRRGTSTVSVAMKLHFSPPAPICRTAPTTTTSQSANLPLNASQSQINAAALADSGRTGGGGSTSCETLVYALNVEGFPDTGEITFKQECDPCDKKREAAITPEQRAADQRRDAVIDQATENLRRLGPAGTFFGAYVDLQDKKAAEKQAERELRNSAVERVNWTELLPALRKRHQSIWEVIPRNVIIRGTVASIDVSQDTSEPRQWYDIAFRESPITDVGPNRRPYSEFNACTSNPEVLAAVFGTDFRTSMIGKVVEVEGETQGAVCRGLRGSIRITLAHQIRPAESNRFANAWIPPAPPAAVPEAAPPPPPTAAPANPPVAGADDATMRTRIATSLDQFCSGLYNPSPQMLTPEQNSVRSANQPAIKVEVQACVAKFDLADLLNHQRLAMRYCLASNDYTDPAHAERFEPYNACMNQNDTLTAFCTQEFEYRASMLKRLNGKKCSAQAHPTMEEGPRILRGEFGPIPTTAPGLPAIVKSPWPPGLVGKAGGTAGR